jgi:type I restriction-modification system DNA methylase subunit
MDDVIRGQLLPLIFTEDKDFILNSKSEENNIIKIINEFNNIIIDDITIKAFSTISIYEYFNSGYEGKSKNKKMGQFFTPKKIINSILYGCQFKNMVDEFEKNMQSVDKKFTRYNYDAGHGFANPSNPSFVAAARDDAYEKTLAFLKSH